MKKETNEEILEKHISDIGWLERNRVLAAMEEVRANTTKECKDVLLKQTFLMVHNNGYPSEAVPKATILSLPSLMKLK